MPIHPVGQLIRWSLRWHSEDFSQNDQLHNVEPSIRSEILSEELNYHNQFFLREFFKSTNRVKTKVQGFYLCAKFRADRFFRK